MLPAWCMQWFLLVTSPTFLLLAASTRAGPDETRATPRTPRTGRRLSAGVPPPPLKVENSATDAGSAKLMSWLILLKDFVIKVRGKSLCLLLPVDDQDPPVCALLRWGLQVEPVRALPEEQVRKEGCGEGGHRGRNHRRFPKQVF